MKNIIELTKEEYDEMNNHPEWGYESFKKDFIGLNHKWLFSKREIDWLVSHNYDIGNDQIVPEF